MKIFFLEVHCAKYRVTWKKKMVLTLRALKLFEWVKPPFALSLFEFAAQKMTIIVSIRQAAKFRLLHVLRAQLPYGRHPSIYQFIHPCIHPSVCQWVSESVNQSILIRPFVHLSVYPSFRQSVSQGSPSVSRSVGQSVSL